MTSWFALGAMWAAAALTDRLIDQHPSAQPVATPAAVAAKG